MSLVFGKYEKIRRIAMGGMGEVFLARQKGVLDRLAILKSLRGDLAQEREFVEQFLDEARVAATLNHPNIVSIYDVGDWNGTFYIAMEYVPGEDLSKLWYAAAKAGVGLPFQVSVRVCYEAALGLDHAHKARDVRGNPLNIVHRDVSPQNIMVRGDGVVKLVDFGIAKAANKSSRTQAGMVKGKLQYMSPEQVRGEALDGRSDQFSLGVVLWEMCTGRRLFKAENEVQTLNKILQAPIAKPSAHVPGFPAELESVIMRMLTRDAEQRFKNLGEVGNELKGYLERSSIANGEISVAGFVQQILGNELEERTRDLTPMETTEAGVVPPVPKERGTAVGPQEPRTTDPRITEPNDGNTQVLPPPSDRVQGQVRTVAGQTLSFDDAAVLRQWVLDGQLGADDIFTTDGARWLKVKEAKDLQKFLEIANATRDVSASTARPRGVMPADPAPAEVTRPLVAAEPHPATLNLSLPGGEHTDPATGAFSLGDLPPSHTGTWGAPDIAAALRKKEADGELDGTKPARVQTRIPTFVWMLAGVAGALLVVVAAFAVLAPQLLGVVVAGEGDALEVRKALGVVKADDPAAVDALLATLESQTGARVDADLHAAVALLHVARARVEGSAAALDSLAEREDPLRDKEGNKGREKTSDKAGVARAAAIDKHRGSAYRRAGEARAAHDGVAAALAMAAVRAESGARPEFEAEGKRAREAEADAALKALVDAEVTTLALLADAQEALASEDSLRQRKAARALATRADDARARHAALPLHLAVARARGDGAADALESARSLVGELASGASDPRPAPARKVLRALDEAFKRNPPKIASRTADAGPAASESADAGPGAAALKAAPDAGTPARRTDAGPAVAVVPPDAGPAAVVDAGPPETYESAMERADAAFKLRRFTPAAKAYTAALKLKPGDSKAQLGLGWSFLKSDRHEPAQVQFQRVITKEPANAEAYSGLGEALRQLGRTEDAKKAFEKYLELAPKGPDAEIARNAIRALE